MSASDDFAKHGPGLTSPLTGGAAVTPDDSNDLAHVSRAVHIGTAGDLKVDMADGSTVTWPALVAGWHPLRVTRIYATGTTASDISCAY